MQYLLLIVASLLVFHHSLGLATLLLGLWTCWQSWRCIHDADAVWLEEAECVRSQGHLPHRTTHWEHRRITCARWYGGIGLIGLLVGFGCLMTLG